MFDLTYLYLVVYILGTYVMTQPTPPPMPSVWTDKNINYYPNFKDKRCKNNNDPAYVCDPNGVLSTGTVATINDKLVSLRNSGKKCICGKECDYTGIPVVVTLVQGFGSDDDEKMLQLYGQQVYKSWNFYTCNDGIVIFASKQSNMVRVEVGSSIQSFLNLTVSYCVIGAEEKGMDKFLVDLISNYTQLRENSVVICGPSSKGDPSDDADNTVTIIIIVVVVLVLVAIVIAFVLWTKSKKRSSFTETRHEESSKPLNTLNA